MIHSHVDGTARIQTVDRSTIPRFYGVIEVRRAHGVRILNTSFNLQEKSSRLLRRRDAYCA